MVSIKASLKLRLIAFLKHALISFVVVLCLLIFLKLVWFQGALFSLERVWNGFSILLLVDVVVGPLLTFLIYEPSKKSLKNDILIIVTLQIIALIYGIIQIHSQRPVIITYVGDRFQVILQNQNVLELLPGFLAETNTTLHVKSIGVAALWFVKERHGHHRSACRDGFPAPCLGTQQLWPVSEHIACPRISSKSQQTSSTAQYIQA